MTRKYQQTQRAQRTAETRHRIVQATVDLHGTLGPAHTTISAIAEKAGVRRATVYEHFPDEKAIFEACTQHFHATHPPPDYHRWITIPDPIERTRLALTDTYAYHQATEPMMTLALRDAALKPVMWEVAATQHHIQYWQAATNAVLEPFATDALVTAAIRHAMAFQTWQSLVRAQHLTNAQAVELMTAMVRGIPNGSR